MKITYKKSGIDYSKIDPLKIMAQKAAKSTTGNIASSGFHEIESSRGESAYVLDMGSFHIATVTECLGTKSLIADKMRKITRKTYYDAIAQDTVAMAVNDLVSVGAKPLVVHAYWATGGSDWFDDKERMADLVRGWKNACDLSGVAWGGGETPGLAGIIAEGACDLAASCMGIIQPKERLSLGDRLSAGDAILILESSGIHANGISLARSVAETLPDGYSTDIGNGTMLGDALLVPTLLYSRAVELMFEAGTDIRYMSNITGHGWRKIMRHSSDFTYTITVAPPVPAVLSFIVSKAGISPVEAYGTFNMGAGYAVFIPQKDVDKAVTACMNAGVKAYCAGSVVKGNKKVVIEPLDLTFEGESLDIRG